MKISILEKVRAPSRIAFCEGLIGGNRLAGRFLVLLIVDEQTNDDWMAVNTTVAGYDGHRDHFLGGKLSLPLPFLGHDVGDCGVFLPYRGPAYLDVDGALLIVVDAWQNFRTAKGRRVATASQNEAKEQHRDYCQESLHVLIPPVLNVRLPRTPRGVGYRILFQFPVSLSYYTIKVNSRQVCRLLEKIL